MEVKNLTFGYGAEPVLKDISFKVADGKITTLLGANGCGKSTLFYIMTKNLVPDSGSVLLNGKDIRRWGPRFRETGIHRASEQYRQPGYHGREAGQLR